MIGHSASISERLRQVLSAVEAARATAERADPVTVVAVTKTVAVGAIREAYLAGQRVFGENRVQEAVSKIEALAGELPEARWHLIGHLQSNKVRPAAKSFAMVESVDSVKLAGRLDAAAGEAGTVLPVLVEVNVAEEPSKHGFLARDLEGALTDLARLDHLEIRGLMTVAPLVSDPEDVRWVFRRLRELRDSLRGRDGLSAMNELSMGMSGDFPVAIQEGATMVRIGRGIFGERPVERG
jgi:pyridoxal phosphate enzyme (YggS family)